MFHSATLTLTQACLSTQDPKKMTLSEFRFNLNYAMDSAEAGGLSKLDIVGVMREAVTEVEGDVYFEQHRVGQGPDPAEA